MAGIGKSTISRLLANHSPMTSVASFFKRGEGERGNASWLFITITAQLIPSVPDITRITLWSGTFATVFGGEGST